MAELFDKSVKTISEHISNIFKEGELDEEVVVRNFQNTTQHGAIAGKTQTLNINIYNLDVIISVGYRVKSKRGTQFRQWATKVLKQHLVNGYSVNEVRVKQIESSLEELVLDNKIKTKEIAEIKDLLRSLIAKPVIIHNHNKISIGSDELENKLICLIDQIIENIGDNKALKIKLEEVKSDISKSPKNLKTKNRLTSFFQEIGDNKSDIHKTIKGAGIAKNVILEIVKLSSKLKDFF